MSGDWGLGIDRWDGIGRDGVGWVWLEIWVGCFLLRVWGCGLGWGWVRIGGLGLEVEKLDLDLGLGYWDLWVFDQGLEIQCMGIQCTRLLACC